MLKITYQHHSVYNLESFAFVHRVDSKVFQSLTRGQMYVLATSLQLRYEIGEKLISHPSVEVSNHMIWVLGDEEFSISSSSKNYLLARVIFLVLFPLSLPSLPSLRSMSTISQTCCINTFFITEECNNHGGYVVITNQLDFVRIQLIKQFSSASLQLNEA